MKIRVLFLILFFLIFLVLNVENQFSIEHRLLFIANFLVLFLFTVLYLFNHKTFSPFIATYIVFSFLFFILAPMLQLNDFHSKVDDRFFNGLTYANHQLIKANVLILIFNLSFFITYFNFYKRQKFKEVFKNSPNRPLFILMFFLINLGVFIWKYDYLMAKITLVSFAKITDKMTGILNAKFFFYLPFAPLVLGLDYLRKGKKKVNYYTIAIIVFFLLLLVFFYKNPLTAKRNALGPIYISLLFFMLPKWVNTNFKILSLMFFSLVVLFPISSLLTHADKNLSDISFDELISRENIEASVNNQFISPNFDAFIMTAATIDYTEKKDFTYGRQLLPAVLFFIPRSIWSGKPISTGQLMGEHIQDYHDKSKWFHNLADPLVAEAYIDFGYIGVILYAMLLALLCLKFVNWLRSNDPLKQFAAFYFAIHLIFLLRGDFTNGYVYFVLPFIAFYVLPKILMRLFKFRVKI